MEGVLRLPTQQLRDGTPGRCSEVGDETIDNLLCSGRVVADRVVDNEVDGHGLADVLPRNERIGNQRVLLELDLVARSLTVLVVNIQSVRTVRRTESASRFRGARAVQRLSHRVNCNSLRIGEQDNSVIIGVEPICSLQVGGRTWFYPKLRGSFLQAAG